ncbi:unnamed protein product [Allacma fusca]|uniref:Cation/H+ exchanger transmembrane domain-containing protein n=1 Tax=Allacma fusca TaxID=39272 RepID=A0A8J2LHW7_9HEXA|nr:unnamed protein product [Allacma fusca]
MSFLVPNKSVGQMGVSTMNVSNTGYSQTETSVDGTRKEDGKSLSAESSSVIHFYPHWCHCSPCLLKKKYRHRDNVSCCLRCKNAFLCPPSGMLSRCMYFFMANALFWTFSWCLDPWMAQDTISALIILELLGLSFGIFFKLMGLPALLAPLIIGIIFNNIPDVDFFRGLHDRRWIGPIRTLALTIILTRAGVELSPKQLKKLKGVVPFAAFGPCIVEAMTCAVLFYFLFENVQWAICFVAGFALAAVSPAVVVPGMLSLKKKNYGVQSGIPTLLIAASSIDDVLAISCFAISLSFVSDPGTEKKEKWKNYVGVLGVFAGIVHGLIIGIIIHFIPSKDMGHKKVPYLRVFILLLLNFCTMFLYEHKETHWLSGAGSVGVLTTSFIGSFGWRSVPHWKSSMHRVENALAHIWTLFVPMLFGTIGREIVVDTFNWNEVGKLCAIIGICLIIRCTTMFVIVLFVRKANYKERFFCAMCWIPKATVQATLAPLVISEFETSKNKHLIANSKSVVLLAVLGILITAPLGSILISICGKRLLRKATDVPDEFPNGEGEPVEDVTEITMIPSFQIVNMDSDEFAEQLPEGDDRLMRIKTSGTQGPDDLANQMTPPKSKIGYFKNKEMKSNSV